MVRDLALSLLLGLAGVVSLALASLLALLFSQLVVWVLVALGVSG